MIADSFDDDALEVLKAKVGAIVLHIAGLGGRAAYHMLEQNP